MRKCFVLLVLVLLSQVAFSLNTFEFQETDLVGLIPEGDDPDNDKITYSFSLPLNTSGEWQTDYGNAGNYSVIVTASDGNLSTSEEVLLIITKKEEPPQIESFSPVDDVPIKEGTSQEFTIEASDLNQDKLSFVWYVDETVVEEGPSFSYAPSYFEQGSHTITALVSDGELKAEHTWQVEVEDVDRSFLLDSFEDILVEETETVTLQLPDFEKYQLNYSISDPIGIDGIWETTYDDAGGYEVTIRIEEGTFVTEKQILIVVKNKDRAPHIEPISDVRVRENNYIEIRVNATDPDGDTIDLTAEGLPGGATFKDGVFRCTIGYDAVVKEDLLSEVMDRFHLLSKQYALIFVAATGNSSIKEQVSITVLDENRRPEMPDLADININEGDTLHIVVDAADPDGDSLSYRCSGWINVCDYTTDFDDAGTYVVTVTASDSFLSDSKDILIKVHDVDRSPQLSLSPYAVSEGSELKFRAEATDPESKNLTTEIINAPENSTFENSIFSWVPPYSFTNDQKSLNLTFKVSDGTSTITSIAPVSVFNTNTPPQILNISPVKEFTTYTGNKVQFSVEALDMDNDTLQYLWKFSALSSHDGGATHTRTFSSVGTKKISLKVSDGTLQDEATWIVHVVSPEEYLALIQRNK